MALGETGADMVVTALREAFGLDAVARPGEITVSITADQLLPVVRFARDQLGFSLLSAVTAVDYRDDFELAYHLVKLGLAPTLDLRLRVGRDQPTVPSLTGLFRGANLQEREVYDLMGIAFESHPDLRRVLTWPGFVGHPLRKDYDNIDQEIPWELAGMRPVTGETGP